MQKSSLLRRGLLLEYCTLGWNVIGCVIVMITAFLAHSVALAGFGFDSVIEIFASVVVVWQLLGVEEGREKVAMRLIGGAFICLAIYIIAQLAYALIKGTHAHTSVPGMIWLLATFIAMLALAWGKNVTGKQLNNPVLQTEGKVTLVDAYLAGAVLLGLVLNALFGWWWADGIASLVIVYYGLREAIHALHESAA